MPTIKVKTPRLRKGYEAQAYEQTTAGELADRVAEALCYGGHGHTLAHAGSILRRESRVIDAMNHVGAKADFELVLA